MPCYVRPAKRAKSEPRPSFGTRDVPNDEGTGVQRSLVTRDVPNVGEEHARTRRRGPERPRRRGPWRSPRCTLSRTASPRRSRLGDAPGGTAKIADPMWRMYSLSRSVTSARWRAMNWLGERWNARKNSPASSRPYGVVAVDVVVAAPQDPDPAVVRRVGQADVGRRVDHRRAVGRSPRSRASVNSSPPLKRRARALGAAEDRLLLGEPDPIPGLDEHLDLARRRGTCRRRATPGVARSAPRRAASTAAVSSARMLLVPSLKPIRLRGVCWVDGRLRRPPEAHLRPADGRPAEGDARQVAHRVDGDLWIVGADLDAQVAVAPLRLERVADERRQPLQLGRSSGGQSEPVDAVQLEQRSARTRS